MPGRRRPPQTVTEALSAQDEDLERFVALIGDLGECLLTTAVRAIQIGMGSTSVLSEESVRGSWERFARDLGEWAAR